MKNERTKPILGAERRSFFGVPGGRRIVKDQAGTQAEHLSASAGSPNLRLSTPVYLPCDYRAALAAFSESGKLGLMSVYRNEGLWDASNVEFTGGRILAYDKANRTPAM